MYKYWQFPSSQSWITNNTKVVKMLLMIGNEGRIFIIFIIIHNRYRNFTVVRPVMKNVLEEYLEFLLLFILTMQSVVTIFCLTHPRDRLSKAYAIPFTTVYFKKVNWMVHYFAVTRPWSPYRTNTHLNFSLRCVLTWNSRK